MAKKIEPVQLWVNGENKLAEFIQVTGINDNYESQAVVWWQLFCKVVNDDGIESAGEQLSQGNCLISGLEYQEWGDVPSINVNAWIYNWTAEQINVVII